MRALNKTFIIFFLIVLLAGCSNSPSEQNDFNSITVWHWLSDRDDTFRELARRFESQTKIKVKFELFAPSEVYQQKVKASAQTGTLPDIYGILGEKRDFASFIRAGFVKNLTGEMAAKTGNNPVSWQDTFFEKALAVNQFEAGNEFGIEPGTYGVPLDASTIEMLYSKDIYRQVGLDPEHPPRTWEEFVGHNRILKEKGYPGFVSGFGEIWMIDAFASNYAMNLMGEKKVFDTYRGKVSYADADWIQVLSLFREMSTEKILVDGAVTMVNKMAEQTFVNARATYAFNGSWAVNVYRGMNPNLDYGAFPPPAISPAHPMRVWGGAGTSFVINKQSKKQDTAVRFLRWMTAPEQQSYLAQTTEGLPSTRASLQQLPPILAQFAGSMGTVTHPNLYPVHEYPAVVEAFDKGIQSILIGEQTPEQVAVEVQRIKEKELAKAQPGSF